MADVRVSQLDESGPLAAGDALLVSQLDTVVVRTATTLSLATADNSVNDSGGQFLTAGFSAGDQVRINSPAMVNPLNNINSATILSLTANKMVLSSPIASNQAAGISITVTKWVSRRLRGSEIVSGSDTRLTNAREWTAETVTQAEAEFGAGTVRRAWTAERVRQAIIGWWTGVGTTVGKALINLANPNTIAFLRINADNSVTARSPNQTREDIGADNASNLVTGTLPAARFTDVSHGNRAGGTLHATATTSTAGFMSAADKTALDGVGGALSTKADKSTTLTAGTGLTGGGDLSANRSFAVSYGTTAGTAAQGNDSRLSNSREWTAATVTQVDAEAGTSTTRTAWTAQRVRQAIVAWWTGSTDKTKLDGIAAGATANQTDAFLLDRANHTGAQAQSTVTGLVTDLAAKADKATTLTAGTGLTGGGDLSANRSFAVAYGTTAGTAAEGNDARLSDSREWTASTITQAEAEAGTATGRRAWTAQRVRQAIVAWWNATGTTVGKALINLANPSAIRFIRINADNTVTARSDSEMRTDLGLGTAATATLTTSKYDTTAGRVSKVGDYGWGAPVSFLLNQDFDSYTTPGVYGLNSSGATNPPPVPGGWMVNVVTGDTGTGETRTVQSATGYGTASGGKIYERWWDGTAWSSWYRIHTTLNTISVAEGGTGATTAATARTNLGVNVSPPASASAAGEPGQFAYDANFFYVCTAANTWRRTALSAW